MKQPIIIMTAFCLLVACKKSNNNEETKKIVVFDKENSTHTNTKKNDNTAVNNALSFINSYIVDCGKTENALGYSGFINTSNLTTDNLKTELKKIINQANKLDPEMGLDFDPIIDAQDYIEEGFELDSFDTKTNFIVVKAKKSPDFKVTIKMVLENNKWLVDGCGVINIPKNKQSKR